MKPLSALIAELRKLASAATPGPYKEDLGNGTVESTHPDHYRAEVVGRADIGERASWYRQAGHGETWVLPDCDIEFVAACDPQTILRLCDKLEEALYGLQQICAFGQVQGVVLPESVLLAVFNQANKTLIELEKT